MGKLLIFLICHCYLIEFDALQIKIGSIQDNALSDSTETSVVETTIVSLAVQMLLFTTPLKRRPLLKKVHVVLALLPLLSAGSLSLFGQTASPASTAAVVAPPPAPASAAAPVPAGDIPATTAGKLMLREGTDVHLKFAQDLSSKTAADGDPVVFLLDDDLKVEDVIVAKAGSKAFGEVTNAKKSGMMGKAGELNIRLDYLKTGDEKIRLRGTKAKEGESGTTGAVVLTVLFGPIGLIKHGKNIDIKQGTALTAYVSDDIKVPPAAQ